MLLSRVFPVVVLAILAACGREPSQPMDLRGAVFTGVFPDGWTGGSSVPNAFEVGYDAGVRRGGKYAGYIRSRATRQDTNSFGALSQSVAADGWRGQRIRLSGHVRGDDIVGRGGGLWVRVDGATSTLAFDNMIDFGRGLAGSTDWHEVSIVLDVPQEAIGIAFGALLSGTGVMRTDDVRLEVAPTGTPTTGRGAGTGSFADSAVRIATYARAAGQPTNLDFEGVPAVDASLGTWLNRVATPFLTDAPGSGSRDLEDLGRIVGNARLVALGEATHGTREFFRMKHRVFEYLVESHGFTHFQIEATMPEARAVDRYVTDGVGDPSRLLAGLYFWTWNTDEVLALIQWMRDYNTRTSGPRLRFFGNDMQYPRAAADSTLMMLGRAEPAAVEPASRAYGCLTSVNFSATQYAQYTTEFRDRCLAGVKAVLDSIVARRAQYHALTADDRAWLEQYARLVFQWARMAGDPTRSWRDVAMAENATWIANSAPGSRHFLWAHNAHISRSPGWMGSTLHQTWGDQYRNVAFTFGTGRFNAFSVSSGRNDVQTIVTLPTGSIETAFAATGHERLLFETSRVSRAPEAAIIDRRPVSMRSIGSVYSFATPDSFFERALLPLDYDAVLWFATTTPSRLRPFP